MTVALLVWLFGVGLAWLATPRARFAAGMLARRGTYWAYVLAWPYTVIAAVVWFARRSRG